MKKQKTKQDFGTPYSVEEARYVVKTHGGMDRYHRELLTWLCDEVERLRAKLYKE